VGGLCNKAKRVSDETSRMPTFCCVIYGYPLLAVFSKRLLISQNYGDLVEVL
jgi:hypothetical protein